MRILKFRNFLYILLLGVVLAGGGILGDRSLLVLAAAPADSDWGSCPDPTGDKMLGIRTYLPKYSAIPNVGSRFFHMAIISDTQFEWECESQCTDWLRANGHAVNDKNKSILSNEWHRNSILQLARTHRADFAGIILNGDVTSFSWGRFDDPNEWSPFKDYYRSGANKFTSGDHTKIKEYPVYFGLGNHDYENPRNDCGTDYYSPATDSERTYNHCAYRGVAHMLMLQQRLKDAGHPDTHFDCQSKNNFANVHTARNIKGSLSYSWDVHKVHFVQLNNYPTYHKKWRYGYVSGVHSFDVDIKSSEDWLRRDLARVPHDRLIVINFHDFSHHFRVSNTNNAQLMRSLLGPYADRIAAIFVGHEHKCINNTVNTPRCSKAKRLEVAGIQIPIYFSGSAQYNHYLSAVFSDNSTPGRSDFQMEVCTVDSTLGNANRSNCRPHHYQWQRHSFVSEGGWRVNEHPRELADVNDDGLPDIVGIYKNHVFVALNSPGNSSFERETVWAWDRWTKPNGGWNESKHIRTVVDVNKDGRADILGFGRNQVFVGLGLKSNYFATASSWLTRHFTYNASYRRTKHIRKAVDVNKDGYPDLIGFANRGVEVSLNKGASGPGFHNPTRWLNCHFTLCRPHGYRVDKHPRMVADVNQDGYADLIAFGNSQVNVALNKGTSGSGFEIPTRWLTGNMTYAQGFRVGRHPRFVVDVNDDQRADLVAFNNKDVLVALSNSTRTGFDPPQVWLKDKFTFNHGWNREHPRDVIDMNADGFADIVGFGSDHIYVALNNQTGGFNAPVVWNVGP